jgi:hypothetical protein
LVREAIALKAREQGSGAELVLAEMQEQVAAKLSKALEQ